MKKVNLILLSALCFICTLNAQTINDFSSLIAQAKQLYQANPNKYSKLDSNLRTADIQTAASVAFTERVRKPDLCYSSSDKKYYRIKNVKTGEYLNYSGSKDGKGKPTAVPLTTVATPGEGAIFFFHREGIVLGDGYGLCNSVSSTTYTLNNLDTYDWETTNTNSQNFHVEVSADGDALYIYHSKAVNEESVKKYWRFDTESQTVKYGDTDDYAEWMFEPIASTPAVTNESAKESWYVIRNSSTGKFLHFNKEEQEIETVTAPDSCSLFLLKGESMEYGINLYNYVARANIAQDLRVIGTSDNKYFISHDGNIEGDDIYKAEANGAVGAGVFGETSEWDFEKITNFREVFGHQFYSTDSIEGSIVEIEKVLLENKVSFYNYYSTCVGLLSYILLAIDPQMELSQAANIAKTRENIMELFFGDKYDPNSHKDIFICNVGHKDNEGNAIRRKLFTNSTDLLTSNINNLHTNVWQIFMIGTGQDKYPVIYNTATQTYIGKPTIEGGVATVKMTPNIDEAGIWKFPINDTDILSNSTTVNTKTLIESYELPKYYLTLQNPNAIVLDFAHFESDDEALQHPGTLWELSLSDSYIKEDFYIHATDAVEMFTELIQTEMGLVRNGCEQYICNYPSDDESSSTCHLTDNDQSSVFWTDGGGSNDKRYLIADMGEGTPVSEFYFFMKPNLQTLEGIPASVTVEGSNSIDGGYVVLADNIDLTMLMPNMRFMSSLINQGGESYRYLRFTVNGILGFDGMLDFTLSEFYIFPHNSNTEQAKQILDAFYTCDYMEEDIISPAMELVKMKAAYLLEKNVDNHSTSPQIGQYPSATYNGLAECLANIQENNTDTADELLEAIETFINSVINPIIIFESAWEDGYTNGTAITFKNNDFSLDDANIWDINQWVTLSNTNGNGYTIDPFTIDEEIPYILQIENIPGWENLYDSHREAKNISVLEGGNTLYLAIDGEEGELYTNLLDEPATTTDNKNRAWYLTVVGDNAGISSITDETFINALADFGATFKQALIYEEGYQSGMYTYDENGGLAKSGFDDILTFMAEYYQMGPVNIVKMYQAGQLDDSMISYVVSSVEALKAYFPYFVLNTSATGYYYRLRGGESGNYLMSDITANGELAMGEMASDEDAIAAKTIFYVSEGSASGTVNVMAFDNGRYLKAEDSRMHYDNYPLDSENYKSQNVFLKKSLNGEADKYSIAMGGENQNYLHDGGTQATPADPSNDPTLNWEVELVEKLPVSITSAMMTSICVPVELQIPEGVTVYILTGKEISDGSHTHAVDNERYEPGASIFNLEHIGTSFIPAGMPVLLKAAEGTYHFTINYSESDKSDAELERIEALNELNQLEGTHDARLISERDGFAHHILSKKNGKVGMYKVNMVSAADRGLYYVEVPTFLNTAHRAWLPYSNTMAPMGYSLGIKDRNDDATGIKDIESVTTQGEVIYDIHGRRLEKIVSPGFYIINNKKVLVK